MKTANHHNERGVNWLATEAGVKDRTVRDWLRDGLPHRKVKRKIVFDEGAVVQWLVANKKAKHAASLTKCAVDIEPSKETDTDTMRSMLDRVRLVERYCYAIVEKKTAEKHADIGQWIGQYNEAAEQRRKIEKDLAGVMLSQGEVIPKETVEQEFSDMAQAIRQAFLAVPNSIAPRLVGKQAVTIAEELKRAILDCLRHLAKGAA